MGRKDIEGVGGNRRTEEQSKQQRHHYFFKGAGIVGHPEGNQAAPPRQGDPKVR